MTDHTLGDVTRPKSAEGSPRGGKQDCQPVQVTITIVDHLVGEGSGQVDNFSLPFNKVAKQYANSSIERHGVSGQ